MLVAVPVAGVLQPMAATAAPSAAHGWHVAAKKPAKLTLRRHDVRIPKKLPHGAYLSQTATSTNSVIPAPTGGTTQSTWQVSYTGFDTGSGPAAQAAFQAAVTIWSQIVHSTVPIKVDAQFSALPDGVLGSAGPSNLYTTGDGVYYASALADAMAGQDVSVAGGGAAEDIDASFTNLADADFYFGTDGNVPAGEVDFESVVLHELGHGIGFLGDMSVASGKGSYQVPFAYDEDTYDAATGGKTILSYANNSTALGTALQSQSVYWGGANGVSNDGGLRPKLYAPSAWEDGSSYSHLDEATYPIGNANSLMTPAISANEVVHNPGPIAVGILIDEGWQATLPSLVAAPDPPTGVTGVAGDKQVTVSWSAANANNSPVTGYEVDANTGSGTCTTTSALSCTVTGLTNGTSYSFVVYATNAVGKSAASASTGYLTPAAVPSAPTSVTATAGAGSAAVSWGAAPANGTPVIKYVATASPGGQSCQTAGALGCTVIGLTNGTSYTFTVVATNAVGAGPASSPSTAVTPAGVPTAPSGIAVTAGNASIAVSWSASSGNGSAVSGYEADASPGTAKCTASGLGCSITGLTNGTAYTVVVYATNAIGKSAASATSASVTPAAVPSAPGSVTATAGDRAASLTWTAAAGNGKPVTSYVATASPGGQTCSTSGALGCTVTGLTNGTSYTFSVVATNAVGPGATSASSNAVIPGAVPTAPTGVTASAGDGSVDVSWSAANGNGSAVTGYEVDASPGAAKCTTTTALGCAVTGLTDGTSYTFVVYATNGVGKSLASSPTAAVVPAGPPGAPGSLSATAGDGSVAVSWSTPATNGEPISKYVVTAAPGAATCTTTSLLTCTVTGLTNGTAYTFTVAATNAAGTGPASAATTAVVPAGRPTAPAGVTATAGNTTADVSWTAANGNGSAITGYTVTSSPDGMVCTTTGAAACTVKDLTNGTSYTFTVTATNGLGTGAASAASAAVVPTGPAATAPDAPADAPTVTAGHESATVSWVAPAVDGGHPVSGYDLEVSTDGTTWTSVSGTYNTDPSTTQVVSELTDGTIYLFRVAAINSVGVGGYSPASIGVTPVPPPDDVSGFTPTASRTITIGNSTALSATAFDADTSSPLAAMSVQLLARTNAQATFHLVTTAATSAAGLASVSVRPTVTAHYEFYFPGGSGHAAATGAELTVFVAPVVTAKITKSSVRRGGRALLYGALAPARAGSTVWLQREVAGTWKTLAVHAVVKHQKLPNGKRALGYVLRIPTGSRGASTYRAIVKASSRLASGASSARRVTVR